MNFIRRSAIIRYIFLGLLLIIQAACATQPSAPMYTTGRSPAQADQFAITFLNTLQARSFREKRELCGYFVQLSDGRIMATPPVPGDLASCEQAVPEAGQGVFASYHTHGAYDANYDNEVPSVTDLRADFEFGLNGYVSTPGGRVWRITYETRGAHQVCGQGCVLVDPNYRADPRDVIALRYSMAGLQRRNGPQ
jgi:hypothetical protein